MSSSVNTAVKVWAGPALRALSVQAGGLREGELASRVEGAHPVHSTPEIRVVMSYLSFVGLVGWLNGRFILSRSGMRQWEELRHLSDDQIAQWVLERTDRELRRRPPDEPKVP